MPQKNKHDLEQFERLIRERRSVFPKDFTGEKIDDALVNRLLQNALWAPTHGKTEPWRFKIFKGDALGSLGLFMADTYIEITPAAAFKASKYEDLKIKPALASHVIGIWMKRQESEKIEEMDEIMAVACAVQNLYLGLAVYGIGGYWSTGAVAFSEQTKTEMGLGSKDRFLGFFYLGVPKEGLPVTATRSPLEEKTEWVLE